MSTRSRTVSLRLAAVTLATGLGLGLAPEARAERFDEMEIIGEVLKPEITVVISRENLNKSMDLAKLERSFVDLILESVDRDPF